MMNCEEKNDCCKDEKNRVFLKPCSECVEHDRECPLSEFGICKICGEIWKSDEDE